MAEYPQLFTAGRWTVHPGKSDEFAALWQTFAEWTAEHGLADDAAYLLQDQNNPRRFLSFSGWKNKGRITAWRSRPEFKALVAQVSGLCEAFEPMTMDAVAIVPAGRS
jgi:quinol monooxygenase YgiN